MLQTWELTEMATPEKPRHMGRYWCWVFWEFKVDVLRSEADAGAVAVEVHA